MSPGGVHKIKPADYKKAARVLATSFGDEFISGYLAVGDGCSAEQCNRLNQELLEYIVYAHIIHGIALEVGDFQGIALWMPPGGNLEHWSTIFMSGMWRMVYKLGSNGRYRYFRGFLPFLTKTKRETLGDDDLKTWYLTYIATSAEARGKGYSRKLVEYVTEMVSKSVWTCL
ncbi:N-acetyltransferase (predicted) [Sugiyamaella lignohabitans]|uniref:N-acetyltransferase (Predicted) n=1 Tax=Sugiyamaella lignohabitans TaxID=796027 RepID=A0A167FFI0_9ASCO|nr:N-acetyltransferase (predicted) [Sugiyamaella lignohabitans]ANB15236.1 N-acetyltransferase (predicted) [Sugiyamaella lignohabitans]